MFLCTVVAPTNIAVVKYWGKRDAGQLNLPLNGSLSACLHTDDLRTVTTVLVKEPSLSLAGEEPKEAKLWLNGADASEGARVQRVIQLCRDRAIAQGNVKGRANWDVTVASENSFPTAAGLASSASGYAALTFACATALGVDLKADDCSDIARQGSGSASRSCLPEGGWIKWNCGVLDDGNDSRAQLVAGSDFWPEMRVLVLVVSDKKKETASTAGMQQSVATSEKLKVRVADVVPKALAAMEDAIRKRDFAAFAQLTMDESDSFHDVCADTTPPIYYLTETSRAVIEAVREYNKDNEFGAPGVAYTFDAGPNAVIYALKEHVPAFLARIVKQFGGSSAAQQDYLRLDAETRAAVDAKLPAASAFTAGQSVPATEPSPLKYILSTRVGPGPQILSEDPQSPVHLLDVATGQPKKSTTASML